MHRFLKRPSPHARGGSRCPTIRGRFAAFLPILLLLPAETPARAQELVESLSVSGWEGGAYKRPDGRPFCALWDEYAAGVGLWLGWDDKGFYIDIVDPKLGLEPDRLYAATLQIDDIWGAQAEGYAISKDTIAVTFGEDEAAISAFRRGTKLFLREIGRSYTLNGTKDAVAALIRCYHAVK